MSPPQTMSPPSPPRTPSNDAAPPAPRGSARCLVRTRIPTRFGRDVYVHLYRNSLDDKEHLALVFGQHIRSRSLDAAAPGESDADRLTRGAAVARPQEAVGAGPSVHVRHASSVAAAASAAGAGEHYPLVRLHSECFTGETISSVRCDCGDQLDEAMRLMAVAGEGVIVYLRQEGRGIGLYEKLRAYNLQDQGHDTVAANLLLNHPADLRTYDVASLILADLGISKVRLLTNNPDKLEQITSVGIKVAERVGMVPVHWAAAAGSSRRRRRGHLPHGLGHVLSGKPHAVHVHSSSVVAAAKRKQLRNQAPTPVADEQGEGEWINSSDDDGDDHDEDDDDDLDEGTAEAPVYPEMEAYLRTKVERMRHIIDLEASPVAAACAGSSAVESVSEPAA